MQRLARWNKTENDSRLLENSEGISDGEWNFVEGRRETIERLRFTFTAYGKRQTSVENFSE